MHIDSYELEVSTRGQDDIVNLSDSVEDVVEESGVTEGVCLVYCPHTTASIIVNEDEDGLNEDLLNALYDLVPEDSFYEHEENSPEGNAHAHIKAVLTGANVTLPIIDGELRTNVWQSILLLETDGPRDRDIIVQVFGN